MNNVKKRHLFFDRLLAVFLILAVALSVDTSFSSPPHARADTWAGWDAISTIYYNPAQEDAHNPFLQTAAQELKTYLQQMSGRSWTVVTSTSPAPPAIYLNVNAAQLSSHGDEAFRLVVDANGVTITGKTAIAVRWGAFHLLDEKLGVRWLMPNQAWTVVPTSLATLSAMDEIHEPDYFARIIEFDPPSWEQSDTQAWNMHNRMWGSKYYGMFEVYYAVVNYATNKLYGSNWSALSDSNKQAFFNANPGAFLPSDRTWSNIMTFPFKLASDNSYAITMIIDYARSKIGTLFTSSDIADSLPYAGLSATPNDDLGWSPPYDQSLEQPNDYQDITDMVFTSVNALADNIAAQGLYALCLAYTLYGGVPTFPLRSNIIVPVATDYNFSPLTLPEQMSGYAAKGVKTGVYDYYYEFVWWKDKPVRRLNYVRNIKYYADEGATYFYTEALGEPWGSCGVSLYIASKLLWDTSLDFDTVLDDFCDKAFGNASNIMKQYYTTRDKLYDTNTEAVRFNELSQALVLASGDNNALARIRQQLCYEYFIWKYWTIGYDNLSDTELKNFYTFLTKIRNWDLVTYWGFGEGEESILRAELISRGYSSSQVDALQNFTTPNATDVAGYLGEATTALSGSQNDLYVLDTTFMDLQSAGDTVNPKLDVIQDATTSNAIIIPSSGNENVRILVKGSNIGTDTFDWYSPYGFLVDSQTLSSAPDWTQLIFHADVAGNWKLTVPFGSESFCQVDVPDRAASRLVEATSEFPYPYHEAQSAYFYVPEGTDAFSFKLSAPGNITGSFVDPENETTNFNVASGSAVTFNNPVTGVWKFTVNAQTYLYCNTEIKGIPPLVWHDPEYLLVPGNNNAVPPNGDPDVNSDGWVNILDIIDIAQHWHETGANGWIPEDVNIDGTIDIRDITLTVQNWTG